MQNENLSLVGKFFRSKWVWLAIAVDVIIVIAIVVVIIYNATKSAIISFEIAPIDATITVNGDSSYRNGSFQFHPGTYEINISHEGLDSKNFTVELDTDSNAAITTFLSSEGGFDFYRLKDNYSSFLMLARIAASDDNKTTDKDTSAEEFIEKFQYEYSKYSNDLPVTYSEYNEEGRLKKYITIRAKYDCMFTLCLEAIVFDEEEKKMVVPMLENAGFDVEEYEIEYVVR